MVGVHSSVLDGRDNGEIGRKEKFRNSSRVTTCVKDADKRETARLKKMGGNAQHDRETTRQSCFSGRSNCQDSIPEYGHMILRDFWDGANKSKVDGARVKESGTDPARTRREGGVGDVPFLEGSGWWRVRPPSVKLREVLRDERLCTSYTSYKRYRDVWNPRRSRLAITGKFRM